MTNNFTEVKPLRYWVQHILPLVYDDSLSYMELLGKVVKVLNEVVKNNNLLPDYIMELIKEYISSGEIEKVLADVLANYMLNVKFPPAGLTPATGNGSADDTEAIQGCIDYAYNNGGMSVYFPSGSYLTQPLTLRNKATLFGQDRYTTRLVMKGGATTAMFTGDVDELTLTGLGFDGNMDIQVNNVNLFTISVNSAIITNCLLTDGYELLNVTVNDNLQLNDIIFRHAVENALVLKGNGTVQGNNLIFKSVSELVGKNFVVMDVSKSILEQLKCYGASPNAVLINGSNNVVRMWNEQSLKAYTDNGVNNTVEVYTQTEQKNLTGSKTTNINGNITETVGGDKTETITGEKEVTANSLTENIANEKHTIAGSVTENITGDKHVNVANSVETITGDKTITAGDISETADNKTSHIKTDKTEQIDGNKNVIVKNNSTETITNAKNIKAKDVVLDPENPLTYKTPDDLSLYFKSVKFKDKNNNIYDVLVNANVSKLESLISGMFYAENVTAMIANTNVINNSIVLTACYSLLNDGGNGVYVITDNESEFSIPLSNGLYANLLYTDCCNILQFGANTSKDDNTAEIQKAIDFSVSKRIKLYVPNGTYKVKNLVAKENLYMFGEGYNSVLNLTEGSFTGDPEKFNYFLNGCIRDIALLGNQELSNQNGFDMCLMRATLENTFVKYFSGVAYNLQQANGTGDYEYQALVNNGENHGLYYANAIFCGTGFILTQYDGFYVNILSSRCKTGLQASSAKILNAHIWGYEAHGCRLGTGQYTNIEVEAAIVPNPASTILIEEGVVNINNLYLWNIATDNFYIWTNENTHLIINGISVGSKGDLNPSDKTLLQLIGGSAKHVYVTGFVSESFTNGNLVNVNTQNSYRLFVGSPQLTDSTRTRFLTASINWTGAPLNLFSVFPNLPLAKIMKADILNEEGNTMCLLYEFNNTPFLNIVVGNNITQQYPAKTLTLSLTIIP